LLSIETIALALPARRSAVARGAWPVGATLAVMGVAYLPLLVLQARLTWGHPHYRFFPLIVLGAGLIGARAPSRLGRLVPGGGRCLTAMLGSSWALLAAACAVGSAWLATVGAMVALLAIAHALGGGRLMRSLLPAWGLLWLAIPPPLGLDYQLVTLLQGQATSLSSRVLDMLGVFHLREGTVIRLTSGRLLVAEACSGIHSLFAVLAGTLFLVVWTRRSAVRGCALIAAAVTWVFLGNVGRIVAVVYVGTPGRLDLSTGWKHEAVGLVVFALALGLTASSDCLFSFGRNVLYLRRTLAQQALIGSPRAASPDRIAMADGSGMRTRLPALSRTRLASWRLAAVFGVLIVVQPLLIRSLLEDYLLPGPLAAGQLRAVHASDLPAFWGPLEQQAFSTVERDRGSDEGRFARRWTYRWAARSIVVSMDGPFQGWHELTRCYVANGWTVRERSVQSTGTHAGAIAVVRLVRPEGREGNLLFSVFNEHGAVLEPDNFGGRLGLLDELRNCWRRQSRQRTYQLQLWTEGSTALTPSDLGQALAFVQEVRSRLAQHIGNKATEASR
jgi:exosortase